MWYRAKWYDECRTNPTYTTVEQAKRYCQYYDVWCEYANGLGSCVSTSCLKGYNLKEYTTTTVMKGGAE